MSDAKKKRIRALDAWIEDESFDLRTCRVGTANLGQNLYIYSYGAVAGFTINGEKFFAPRDDSMTYNKYASEIMHAIRWNNKAALAVSEAPLRQIAQSKGGYLGYAMGEQHRDIFNIEENTEERLDHSIRALVGFYHHKGIAGWRDSSTDIMTVREALAENPRCTHSATHFQTLWYFDSKGLSFDGAVIDAPIGFFMGSHEFSPKFLDQRDGILARQRSQATIEEYAKSDRPEWNMFDVAWRAKFFNSNTRKSVASQGEHRRRRWLSPRSLAKKMTEPKLNQGALNEVLRKIARSGYWNRSDTWGRVEAMWPDEFGLRHRSLWDLMPKHLTDEIKTVEDMVNFMQRGWVAIGDVILEPMFTNPPYKSRGTGVFSSPWSGMTFMATILDTPDDEGLAIRRAISYPDPDKVAKGNTRVHVLLKYKPEGVKWYKVHPNRFVHEAKAWGAKGKKYTGKHWWVAQADILTSVQYCWGWDHNRGIPNLDVVCKPAKPENTSATGYETARSHSVDPVLSDKAGLQYMIDKRVATCRRKSSW